jgi:hypothetical protein
MVHHPCQETPNGSNYASSRDPVTLRTKSCFLGEILRSQFVNNLANPSQVGERSRFARRRPGAGKRCLEQRWSGVHAPKSAVSSHQYHTARVLARDKGNAEEIWTRLPVGSISAFAAEFYQSEIGTGFHGNG